MAPATATRSARDPFNVYVATLLDETAQLLHEQGADRFRVQAYRNAASTIRALHQGADDILDREGLAGLDRLPGIGQTLSRVIDQIVTTGHFPMLERLRGAHVSSAVTLPPTEPSVVELLEIDREYREKSAEGRLPLIAPRKLNPTLEKWLPVMHATRDGTHYTALFSNTARAHDRGKTHDWVVIYFEQRGTEGQRTIVTATSGDLAGRRVVRGREMECAQHYHIGQRSA
jgi:hypothetical protein